MEDLERGDRIKENSKKIGTYLGIAVIVVVLGLAILGVLTVVGEVPAFIVRGGLEPTEMIQVGDVASILIDEDGDGKFDSQIKVASLSALRDIVTGEVFLSVTGSTPASE
ncbi:hypothetical protein DRH13_02155 [Candidatus Woesebacteria bacterium]|nr:MAG: hypothetical protein DRH13_02155 [Candidatus Woesebacteria bacterium]